LRRYIKARLLGHHGFVAVKRVRADLNSSDMMAAQFKKEMLALLSLRHAHVVVAVACADTRPLSGST
jgi:hypothetical protein